MGKCTGLSKAQCNFGRGIANVAGGLLDAKNTRLKVSTARYVHRYKR